MPRAIIRVKELNIQIYQIFYSMLILKNNSSWLIVQLNARSVSSPSVLIYMVRVINIREMGRAVSALRQFPFRRNKNRLCIPMMKLLLKI